MERLTVMTLAEIAEVFGCTPQAIRKSEKSALRKIRRAFIEREVIRRIHRGWRIVV